MRPTPNRRPGRQDAAKSLSGVVVGLGAATAGMAMGGNTGAVAAFNVDTNNRQFTHTEADRIKQLAKGDAVAEYRLTAAACAMVHCADGVPENDPSYATLKSLQDQGAGMKSEQALLDQQWGHEGRATQPLFGYTWVNKAGDSWNQNVMGTRTGGALQAAGGALLVASGTGECATGIGCVLGAGSAVLGADNLQAGVKTALSGIPSATYGQQALQSLGMSSDAAGLAYALAGLSPAAVDTFLLNRATNAAAQANAAARASYLVDDGAQAANATTTGAAGGTATTVAAAGKAAASTSTGKSSSVGGSSAAPASPAVDMGRGSSSGGSGASVADTSSSTAPVSGGSLSSSAGTNVGAATNSEAGQAPSSAGQLGTIETVLPGRITVEEAARPDANELRAGQGLSQMGLDVTHQATASDLGVANQRTADLSVSGVGQVDVLTPASTTSETNIVRAIERKNNQAEGVLIQTDLDDQAIQSIASRVWGKPSVKNINTLFFQRSDGTIVQIVRPAGS